MRLLGAWAAVIVGSAVLSAPGCLTSQDGSGDGGGVEDPPVTIRGGSSGSDGQGGGAGEGNGGSDRGGRGGTSGTSGTGSGEGGADGGCSDDLDCAFRPDNRSRCSEPTGECVDCLSAADCDASEQCIDNECRPFTGCATSNDCPGELVCDTSTARCVECFGASGCGTGELCVSSTCRKPCEVDSHCTPFGLRCDTGAGYCASCLGDDDCPSTRNCQAGTCVRDICTGGATHCEAGGVATCNEAGSLLGAPVPCASQQSCREDSSGARCEPWTCLPSTTGCSLVGERVVSCSADGLDETLEEDCEAAGLRCIGNMCSDAVCEPNTIFCQDDTRQLCDSTGTSSILYQTCPTGQLCNPASVSCAVPLCTPGQPACDANVATTCNAEGFGFTGTRTDCTATEQFCASGACSSGAVDTIPATPTLYGSPLPDYGMLNFYAVSASRTLSLIEQYLAPAEAVTLTWHVYESTTQTGTYSSISETTTTSTTGAGYQSSGALAVPLVAGRFYAIGVSWSTAIDFGYQTGQTLPQAVSFGSLISATVPAAPLSTTLAWATPSSYFLPQRLTTSAP